ncbi:MAG: tetratricopeptide repeat protein, partial [Bacteroidota bacterium]|nr:tetratricopeptide repeat protein [Bacteroidota bacterium]
MGKAAKKEKQGQQVSKKSGKKTRLFILAGILIFTVLLYSQSINNGILFGWDDGEYLNDKHISELNLKNTGNYFSNYYLGMYQPLSVLTIAINHHFSGTRPAPYHATNLLLHLICIILIFRIFMEISNNQVFAGIAALLFALHPMNVEAVAWIAARSTTLFTLFYLSAILSYLRYLKNKDLKYYFYTLMLFACALFSKSMAMTFPLALILIDYLKQGEISKKSLIDKVPLLVLSFIFGLVTIDAARSFGHLEGMEYSFSLINRLFIISYALVLYIFKFFIPIKLSVIYGFPGEANAFLPVEYYLSIIVIVLIIAGIWKTKTYKKELIFGCLFFLVTIAPVLPIFWSRMFLAGERYVYLPYLGLIYVMGIMIKMLYEGQSRHIDKYRSTIAITAIIYLAFMGATSFRRSKVWKDPEQLLSAVITQDHSTNTLAAAYFFRGNVRDRYQDYPGALKDFNESLKRNPDNILALNNRGIVRGIMNDFKGAITDFDESIKLKPDYADAYYNRGIASFELKQYSNACIDWEKASSLGSGLA